MTKKLYKVQSNITDEQRSSKLNKKNNFVKRHKSLFMFFFIILILCFLFFSFKYLYQNAEEGVSSKLPDFMKEQLTRVDEEEKLASLKETDTDHDGLTDYQELYQYHTSMFLEDTDSDGYSDYDEIMNGEEALCPAGERCNILNFITPETKLADIVQEVTIDADLSIQDATLREFRQFLLDNGISQENVDELSDIDLLAIFQVIQENQITPPEEWEDSITPEEVRSFLLSQTNVDHNDVNDLTDEDLLDIAKTLMDK